MPGFFGDDQVRRVKERIDLVQLMSEYTPLRKSGATFSGCCPFHGERTPSLYVYPENQTYYCFGCSAHGDAITLIREKERLEFTDAIELLAKRAGITLTIDARDTAKRSQRDRLLPLVELATAFYESQLWEAPAAAEARGYLQSRKLSEEVCRRFRLGWAPGGGLLVSEARRRGYTPEMLLSADLAVDRKERLGDRFFERITFPIFDRFGNPVAFSARLLPAAERAAKEAGRGVGKYVNNTDTPLYHKGSVVFNLHRARTAVRAQGRIVVMEGPTDVMAASQAGYTECVAVLGTALTPEHARQLGNIVGNEGQVVLLLDGDRAGQANGLKGVRTCMSVGVPVRVALLPEELDPAELLAEGQSLSAGDGRALFERVLTESRGDLEHLLRATAPRPYELDHRKRLAAADEILAAVATIPDPALRELHRRDVAEYFGIERELLAGRAGAPAGTRHQESARSVAAPEASSVPTLPSSDDAILHILAKSPALRSHAADDLGLEPSWFPPPWSAMAYALLQEGSDTTTVLALPEVEAHQAVRQAAFRWVNMELAERRPAIGDARGCLDQAVARLQLRHLQDHLLRLSRELEEVSTAGDHQKLAALSGERIQLERRISDLRGLSESAL
jgi:DNA primase catalytic core